MVLTVSRPVLGRARGAGQAELLIGADGRHPTRARARTHTEGDRHTAGAGVGTGGTGGAQY